MACVFTDELIARTRVYECVYACDFVCMCYAQTSFVHFPHSVLIDWPQFLLQKKHARRCASMDRAFMCEGQLFYGTMNILMENCAIVKIELIFFIAVCVSVGALLPNTYI